MPLDHLLLPPVVLVVEDEMLLRMRAVDMVEDAGYVPVEAVDADEANAHINQASGSHTAAQISYSPGGTVSGTNVQAALAEVASEIDARVTTDGANIAANTTNIATNTAAR